MNKVFFNDPFNSECIERLKFLYLYYDEIEVMDYSWAFEDFAKDNWAGLLKKEDFIKGVIDILRSKGVKDRNALSKATQNTVSMHKGITESVTPLLNKIYGEQLEYWSYLSTLADTGIVKLVKYDKEYTESLDRKNFNIKTVGSKLRSEKAAEEIMNWVRKYMIRIQLPTPMNDEQGTYVLGVISLILGTYTFGGLYKQLNGSNVYTGEDHQIRALSQITNASNPIAARLGERAIQIEVPSIRYVDIEQLSEVREKLLGLRNAFIVQMEALTADLTRNEWNDDLLNEIKILKKREIDPIVFELRKLSESSVYDVLKTRFSGPVKASLGSSAFVIGLCVEMGAELPVSTILAIAGALGGGITHNFIQTLQSKKNIEFNQLAYLIRLQESI